MVIHENPIDDDANAHNNNEWRVKKFVKWSTVIHTGHSNNWHSLSHQFKLRKNRQHKLFYNNTISSGDVFIDLKLNINFTS